MSHFQCCGDTPYGEADEGVLCCNNILYHGMKDGQRCSPSGHIYWPSTELVCGSKVHYIGKHCCGENTYDPKTEICCNGHRHIRSGNMSCCGVTAYNTSSLQKKCCAGTLYDWQGRESQCCGNVLIEAGSNQTCCSASGLALVYNTQPGFTCCGFHYTNASLWSCCAGVLHPNLKPNTTKKNNDPGHKLLPLGDLTLEDLCYKNVSLGMVETVSVENNIRSIVMVNTMLKMASENRVQALHYPHYLTLPDHCGSPELVPGNTYIWVETPSMEISFISDLSNYSSPLHSILSMCGHLI
ncbi:hypothetical protein UPYG_G00196530 [Umbra pygmaea]|uniref:Galaxin-like repeats domain-containing protein n=1 Tax=Umbra pygmaea TaxID=75934 RepID=A0ABD0WHA3_UMBPY